MLSWRHDIVCWDSFQISTYINRHKKQNNNEAQKLKQNIALAGYLNV